jgi:hypothetical protein
MRAQGRQKAEVCKGKEKLLGKKGEEPRRFETPTDRIKCGYKNVSSHLEYLGNCLHAPCKSVLAPRTLRLVCRACRYPITMQSSGTSPLCGPIIGLDR